MSIKIYRAYIAYPPNAQRRRYCAANGDRWDELAESCDDLQAAKIVDKDSLLRKLRKGKPVAEYVIEGFAAETKHADHNFVALHVLSLCILKVAIVMPSDPIYDALKSYIILNSSGQLFPSGAPCQDLGMHLRESKQDVFRSLSGHQIDKLLFALFTRGLVLMLEDGRFVPLKDSMVTEYEQRIQINFRIATVKQTLTDILDDQHRASHTNIIAAELKELLDRCDDLLPSDFNNLPRSKQEDNLNNFGLLESQCECARAAGQGFLREQIQRGVAVGLRLWNEYLALAAKVHYRSDADLRRTYKHLAEKAREMVKHHRQWRQKLIAGESLENLIELDEKHARETFALAKEVKELRSQL